MVATFHWHLFARLNRSFLRLVDERVIFDSLAIAAFSPPFFSVVFLIFRFLGRSLSSDSGEA